MLFCFGLIQNNQKTNSSKHSIDMARNSEKNFARLNRLWLEKGTEKREKRPKLSTLKTSDEISSWLPSIKQELDFFLKQTEVPCYTDHKIKEFCKRIQFLETEYKSFVRKLHQVNSHLKATPWTGRPYEKKDNGGRDSLSLHRIREVSELTCSSSLQFPVLMHDHLYQDGKSEGYVPDVAHPSNQNLPLFESLASHDRQQNIEAKENYNNRIFQVQEISKEIHKRKLNVLGLDYSSSEEET